jgi:hypothetical protein
MAETIKKHRDRPRVGEARQQRDIAIYESHMRGNSIRAIQDEFQIKSTKTVWSALNRGKGLVIERGIDLEERRIEIDQLFANTLGMLAGEIARQTDEGRIQTIERSDGSREVRRTKGVDPRTAEALARSADRWAQFLGITDRGQEVNQASTTLIQLSAPADGASFGSKWAGETVEISASDHGSDHVDVAASSAVLSRSEVSGK